MNKIYKVIWSKVRNCYVAVSEIAKRNGKSCTSVNCGAKADRGRAGMALALTLSLSLAGGGVAWAEIQVPNYTYQNPIEINSNTEENFNIIEGDTTFTVKNGKVKTITSSKSGNIIEVKSGGHVYGYVSYSTHSVGIRGGISDNTVTIYGTVSYQLLGGYSGDSVVTNNKVTISGGSVKDVFGGSGYSNNTTVYDVTNNSVTISAGTVNGDVYGGKHNSSSDVLGNKVEISAGTTVSGFVYGGSSAGNAGGPDTIVGGQTVKNGNTVSITDGTVSKAVYGGNVGSGSGNNAVNNSVTISGSSTIGTPESVIYNKNIYGGYTIGTGNATGNTVNINLVTNDKGTPDDTTDDTGVIWGSVYGGYSNSGKVGGSNIEDGNTVTISGGKVSGNVYGGYGNSSGSNAAVTNNTATIEAGNKVNIKSVGSTADTIPANWTLASGAKVLTDNMTEPYGSAEEYHDYSNSDRQCVHGRR